MTKRKLRTWVIPTFIGIAIVIGSVLWFARVDYINSIIG